MTLFQLTRLPPNVAGRQRIVEGDICWVFGIFLSYLINDLYFAVLRSRFLEEVKKKREQSISLEEEKEREAREEKIRAEAEAKKKAQEEARRKAEEEEVRSDH